MRFKQYINELYKENRTKSITVDEAVDGIVKNCKKNFKSIYVTGSKIPIYRGNHGPYYGFVDTNTGEPRVSANTENYYTLLFDNLPSWKTFPKRSRGLVCSTEDETAGEYGNRVYHVIPYDNSLIGVCPKSDIWMSFGSVMSGDDVTGFNDWLSKMFRLHGVKVPDNWSELVNSIMELDKIYKSGNAVKRDDERDLWDDFSVGNFGIFTKDGHPMDILNKIFDPKKNGFKIGINNLKADREVWIQGKCILVDDADIDGVIKDVIDEI